MLEETLFDTSEPLTAEAHKYDWFVQRMEEIAALDESIVMTSIGKTSNYVNWTGNIRIEPVDMYILDFLPKIEKRGQIILLAGQDAMEPAGSEAAIHIAEKLANSQTYLANFLKNFYQISIIPIGDAAEYTLDLGSRAKREVTRYYHPQGHRWRMPETQNIINAINERVKDTSLNLSVDMHESEKANGYYMITINDAINDATMKLGLSTIESLQKNGFKLVEPDSVPGILPFKCLGLRYEIMDSSKERANEYTFDKFCYRKGALAYTYETPMKGFELKERMHMHISAFERMLSSYIQDYLLN